MNALWRLIRPLLSTFVRYMHISYLEAKSDYQGTALGILWIPASTLIFSAILGLVFRNPGTHTPVEFYLYVLAGYTCWQFISESINSSTNIIQSQLDFAVHNGLSLIGLFAKLLGDRLFEYGLNLIVLIVALVLLSPGNLGFHTLLFPVFLAILAVTSLAVSYLVNLLTIFYPDLANLIKTATRFMFFATPIFWRSDEQSGVRHALERYNPASYFLHISRQVFGVESVDWTIWGIALAITLVTCAAGAVAYHRSSGFVRNLK